MPLNTLFGFSVAFLILSLVCTCFINPTNYHFKVLLEGSLGGAEVWRLPLAQGAILETRDRIPRRAPGAWSLLLPLPMSLPLSLSLSV